MKTKISLGLAIFLLIAVTSCPNPAGTSFPYYTVTYDGNGHSGGQTPTDSTRHRSGTEVTVLANDHGLYRIGHSFLGWTWDGYPEILQAGDVFQILANTTLRAHWRMDSHGLSLRAGADLYVTDQTYVFEEAVFGYETPEVQTITVRNLGDVESGELAVRVLYHSATFTVYPASLGSLAPDQTASFTVRPESGLAAGLHYATIEVEGANAYAWFDVNFTVNQAPVAAAEITVVHPVAGTDPAGSSSAATTIVSGDNFSAGAAQWSRFDPEQSIGAEFSAFGDYAATLTLTITDPNFTFTDGLGTVTINGEDATVVENTGATVTLRSASLTAHTYLVRFYSRAGSTDTLIDETFTFPALDFNYAPIEPQTIVVKNVGNRPLEVMNVALSENADFTVVFGAPAKLPDYEDTTTFTVWPNHGLQGGSRSATVTVSGDTFSAAFTVEFMVNQSPISTVAITVPHPVARASATSSASTATTIDTGSNFTAGAASWASADPEQSIDTTFSNFGVYAATITLTISDPNFTFTGGLTSGNVTINGAPATVVANTGGTATIRSADLTAHTYLVRIYSREGSTDTLIAEGAEFHLPTRSHGATPPTQHIVVRNVGNRGTSPLTVAITGSNAGIFTPSLPTIPSILIDGEATFTITPASGLGVGSYQATVTISNSDMARNLSLRFSVHGLVYMIWVEGGDVEPGVCLGGGDPNTNNPGFGEVVSVPGFYMSRTPITRAEFVVLRNHFNVVEPTVRNVGAHSFNPTWPASQINWYDAIQFANLLSIMEELQPVYVINGETDPRLWPTTGGTRVPPATQNNIWDDVSINEAANGYRIPTNAQWEFAAKGGAHRSPYVFSGSNTLAEVGWYFGNGNSLSPINPGALNQQGVPFLSNALGLYHMSGSVAEFIWEWTNPEVRFQRVRRGGQFNMGVAVATNVASGAIMPGSAGSYLGIRLVRQVPAP